MRAPVAPVGFLLFFVLVNMDFFSAWGGDMCREGFRKDTYVVSSAVFVGSAILWDGYRC